MQYAGMPDDAQVIKPQDLIADHFPAEAVPIMHKVMQAESSGNPNATNKNKNGTTDHGLFQINDVNVPELKRAGIIRSKYDLFDPNKNVQAAAYLYKKRGTQPWDSSKSKWNADTSNKPNKSIWKLSNDAEAAEPPKYAGMPEGAMIVDQPNAKQTETSPQYEGMPEGAEIVSQSDSQEKGLMDKLSQRGSNIAGNFTETPQEGIMPPTMPEKMLRTAGQIAGGVGDVVGAAGQSIYKSVVPESAQQGIHKVLGSILDSDAGKMGIEAIKKGQSYYEQFKQHNPEAAKDIEAVFNIGTMFPIGKGAGVAGQGIKEGANIIKDVAAITAKESPAVVDKSIETTIKRGIERGIRPTNVGKKTATDLEGYLNKATDAVKTIVENKPELSLTDSVGNEVKGSLPSSLKQFGEAIQQMKGKIFKQYDAMKKGAGEAGATIQSNDLVVQLMKDSQNKSLILNAPEVAKYAEETAKRYAQMGELTPETVQDSIKILNQRLEGIKTYGDANKAAVDLVVANHLRKALDDAIEREVGPGYQALKNKYGSLKEIEKDVAHRTGQDARKAQQGVLDLTNIFSVSEIGMGLLTGNVAQAAKGGMMYAIKSYIKSANNPNNIIKNMFKSVERLESKKLPIRPISKAGKAFIKEAQ